MHHVSIRTADIHRAIAFYELLGFQVCERFTAGYTLACWMEGLGGRIELLQVPQPRPAADAFHDEHYTGYYHLSFDLTEQTPNLSQWLDQFQTRLQTQGEDLAPVLLTPRQQQIGSGIYEVMFLADRDGLPLEFLRLQARLASSD
ncbi:VOC family protein [Synechococcus elongatus IITB4]|uniref:VOC family protein n=1 Tax=Synechococcus elongatus TaxID=32046 RepID=UPI0030CF540D